MTHEKQDSYFVYVGTYTHGAAQSKNGIYIYKLQTASGALQPVAAAPAVDPSFLAFAPDFGCLYAVSEVDEFDGKPSGAVSAYRVDRSSGGLSFINQQPTLSPLPCHVGVDKTGKWAIIANYNGGSVSVLPILPDGALGAVTQVVQHHGSSVNPKRQDHAYAHSTVFDPSNRFVLVADLGMDKVMVYRLDAQRGELVAHDPPFIPARPGAGPRHQAFHPAKPFYYVLNEMGSTVAAFSFDPATMAFRSIQVISTLPPGFQGISYCAEIVIAPSGRFAYASNRGHDSITVFAIDEQTGLLTALGQASTLGAWPRNFVLTPDGDMLLAANEHSGSIATFRVDQASGALTPTGHMTAVPAPACIRLMPAV